MTALSRRKRKFLVPKSGIFCRLFAACHAHTGSNPPAPVRAGEHFRKCGGEGRRRSAYHVMSRSGMRGLRTLVAMIREQVDSLRNGVISSRPARTLPAGGLQGVLGGPSCVSLTRGAR